MKTIQKLQIKMFGQTEVKIPRGSSFLDIQILHRDLVAWVFIDPNAPIEECLLTMFMDGENMPDYPGYYLGTFQLDDGTFVGHIFMTKAGA